MWARRCFFGYHDENPPVHWEHPADSVRAIAALNAVTLGVEVGLHFRWKLRGYESSNVTGMLSVPSSLSQEQYLEYGIQLPYFHNEKSSCSWELTIYRRNEGDNGVEKIIYTHLNYAKEHDITFETKEFEASSRVSERGSAENKKSSSRNTVTDISETGQFQKKIFRGSIAISEINRGSAIERASLRLSYWPDREISDGYVEVELDAKL